MQASPRRTVADPDTLERFRRDLGDLWPRVAPLLTHSAEQEDVLAALHSQKAPESAHLTGDLEALVAGWSHYDAAQRAVLTGAASFIAEPPEAAADEVVVSAAVRAVLRRH